MGTGLTALKRQLRNIAAARMCKWALASAAVFTGSGAAGMAQAAPKTLIYCTSNAPAGFDIALYSDLYTAEASGQMIYQRLVAFKPGGTEIIPSLAASWDISPDGKTYIFHLRKGVKFQTAPYFKPSRDFNADDVVFSFNRQADKKDPWHIYADGQSYQYYDGMDMPKIIKSVSKIDDYTVRFELNRPEAPFPPIWRWILLPFSLKNMPINCRRRAKWVS